MEWILLGVVVVAIWFVVSLYNRLVGARNNYKNAFAQIDVQLTRRYDLIPNLVETAKGYIKHERETLEAVILPSITVGDAEVVGETTFQQSTGVPDSAFSLGVGLSSTVEAYHFDVVAVGSGPRGATSTHRQSFYVVGPGGP